LIESFPVKVFTPLCGLLPREHTQSSEILGNEKKIATNKRMIMSRQGEKFGIIKMMRGGGGGRGG
jgi:hypothetical protein